MIDLTSLDNTYTNLKITQIKRLLKDIKPDIKELSASDIINISIIVFAYLIEGHFLDVDEDDLILAYKDDEVILDVNSLTLELKFKNELLNQILSCKDKKGFDDMMKPYVILKDLVGDGS